MTQALTLSRPFDGLRRSAARVQRRGAALWRAYPREVLGLGLFGLVAAAAGDQGLHLIALQRGLKLGHGVWDLVFRRLAA